MLRHQGGRAQVRRSKAFVALGLALMLVAPTSASADLRPADVKTSLLGTHHWYLQTHEGLEVDGGFLVRHRYDDGRVVVDDRRRTIRGEVPKVPAVREEAATAIAGARTGAARDARAELVVLAENRARLAWRVTTTTPRGPEAVLVDALTAEVLAVRELYVKATGRGRVFAPNPVVTLGDPTLTDADDADGASFAGAYRDVPLTALDGSGFLRGDFAYMDQPDAAQPHSEELRFDFRRDHPHFEHVMAYFHLTAAQMAVRALGFTDLTAKAQAVRPNGTTDDNSTYSAGDYITLGTGGVDDGEDADVIWHEFGHALQDEQFGIFNAPTYDMASLGEGFGDYFAVAMSELMNDGYDLPCVADWDAVSYSSTTPACLRRTDSDKTYADRAGGIHAAGMIWSRALWDINRKLGSVHANRVILQAQYAFSGAETMHDAAQLTVDAALALRGNKDARRVRDIFAERGLQSEVRPLPGS